MRLLWQEIRKIWNPAILAAILTLGALYYYVRPMFYIEYFDNGPYAEAEFGLARDWVEHYGPTLEPEERAELDTEFEEVLSRFGEQVFEIPGAAEAGIVDYESFRAYESSDLEDSELVWDIINGTNFYTIDRLEGVLYSYDAYLEDSLAYTRQPAFQESYSQAEQARIIQLKQSAFSLLPGGIVYSISWYFQCLAVWTVLSVILLLSPALVRDRLRRTRAMQWSSRWGKRVLNSQFTAGVLSALGLSALNMAVYAAPLASTGVLAFWDCPLYSHIEGGFPWFDWTCGQYLLALGGMGMLLGLGTGLVTLFLSQYSGNYVAMLLKEVPLFLALGMYLAYRLMNHPFFIGAFYPLGSPDVFFYMPKGGEAIAAFGLLGLGAALWVLAWRFQRRREL